VPDTVTMLPWASASAGWKASAPPGRFLLQSPRSFDGERFPMRCPLPDSSHARDTDFRQRTSYRSSRSVPMSTKRGVVPGSDTAINAKIRTEFYLARCRSGRMIASQAPSARRRAMSPPTTRKEFTVSPVRRWRWLCNSNRHEQPARATFRRTPPTSAYSPISTSV
jgi:hypothetical protein